MFISAAQRWIAADYHRPETRTVLERSSMQLGFVSAIVPELPLEQVADLAAAEGFDCVELMCWPTGKAERRYAGVTHVDVTGFTAADAGRVREVMANRNVAISGLGYYPNP